MNSVTETPVLFLIFNRPETTFRVFEQIRKAQPKYLFIAADGARENKAGEKEKCEEARSVLQKIDWDCEIKTLFRNKNLGCGEAVSGAITWFFQNVEQGIILEDDCYPSQSFFQFCTELLHYYKNDCRIWHIAGYNVYNGNENSEFDYFFSQETSIWGWASWRRVWKNYQLQLKNLNKLERSKLKTNFRINKLHAKSYLFDFLKVNKGEINTWDYQYAFLQVINNGLSVMPGKNLIQNIGFDDSATHTLKIDSIHLQKKIFEIDYSNLKHPLFMIPDVTADNYIYNKRTRLLKKILVLPWFFIKYKLKL